VSCCDLDSVEQLMKGHHQSECQCHNPEPFEGENEHGEHRRREQSAACKKSWIRARRYNALSMPGSEDQVKSMKSIDLRSMQKVRYVAEKVLMAIFPRHCCEDILTPGSKTTWIKTIIFKIRIEESIIPVKDQ
jgi:hypothetical protein